MDIVRFDYVPSLLRKLKDEGGVPITPAYLLKINPRAQFAFTVYSNSSIFVTEVEPVFLNRKGGSIKPIDMMRWNPAYKFTHSFHVKGFIPPRYPVIIWKKESKLWWTRHNLQELPMTVCTT